jgi:hypothetical protein
MLLSEFMNFPVLPKRHLATSRVLGHGLEEA